jgi:hypothetical protein
MHLCSVLGDVQQLGSAMHACMLLTACQQGLTCCVHVQLSELAAACANASSGGQSCAAWARASTAAGVAMAAAQERLQAQRCALARANTALLQELLSPVQAARLMLRAWPAHCDCLGFANAVQVCCTLCSRSLLMSIMTGMHDAT